MTTIGTKIGVGVAGAALATAASLVTVAPAQAAPAVPVPASPVVMPMPASPAVVPMPASPVQLGFGGAPTAPGSWLFDGPKGSRDMLASQAGPRGWFPRPLLRLFRFIICGPYGTRSG